MEKESKKLYEGYSTSFLEDTATAAIVTMYSDGDIVLRFSVAGADTVKETVAVGQKIVVESLGSRWEAMYSERYSDCAKITVLRIHP
ncbi:MAG: hypothetical protein U0T73_02525 [Chitinophagales bacterium]